MSTLRLVSIIIFGLVLKTSCDPTVKELLSKFQEIDKPTPTKTKTLMGADDRVLYKNQGYPYTAIGRILYGKYLNRACTGYLVGKRHVLTNSHCQDQRFPIYYFPNYNNGKSCNRVGKAVYVYNGTLGIDTTVNTTKLPNGFSVANDWAVLVLNESLVPFCSSGYFKVASSFDNNWYKKPLFNLAGYPNAGAKNKYGALPLMQYNCSVLDYDPIYRFSYHDCDTNSGSSGSGIFGRINNEWTIVALNNGEMGSNCAQYAMRKCANLAVVTSKFCSIVNKALSTYN